MFGLLMQDNTPVDWRYRGMGSIGYAPGGPYYPRGARRFRGYGIPPGQAARVPQYGDHAHDLPGVLSGFGEDIPTTGWSTDFIGPLQQETKPESGWTSQNTVDVIKTLLDTTGKVIGAVTSTGQTYYQGSCGPNMVNVPNRGCVATSGSGGGSNTGLLVAGAVGLGLLALMMSRRAG